MHVAVTLVNKLLDSFMSNNFSERKTFNPFSPQSKQPNFSLLELGEIKESAKATPRKKAKSPDLRIAANKQVFL